VNDNPADCRISARRTEAEARTSLISGALRQGYYRREPRIGMVRLKKLEDDGFLIFPKDLAECIGDFSDGGIGFNCTENCGKQIFFSRRASCQFLESFLRLVCVAFCA